MKELIIKKRGVEFREEDVELIETFHKHCLKNALQATLILYGPLWEVAHKFRKKQKKLLKKEEK